ncbi:MAG TPA: CoA pyrophosphatase [Burkholderiaceae bacterium]|jgi:8-oxo-dGTP pyrophosphatase MutT (NUDIX family)|nr:CoA pyrophosphatase [Burkholderiaceae bacterium]
MTPDKDVDPLALTPIFEPEAVPHDPAFAATEVRGAAVAPGELRVSALRQRFASPPAWQPELRADVRLFNPDQPPRAAAVLIPLIVHAEGTCVLLTKRTAHLHDHAGQISFPGGRVDQSDTDAIATALREAHEEIGLPPAQVDVIGTLPEYLTATGYKVTPVVGLIERPFSPVLDAFEVSEIFEVPLAFLMDPINHERRIFQLDGVGKVSRTFYAMPYATPQRAAEGRRYFIWGATAAIVRNLYQFLRA